MPLFSKNKPLKIFGIINLYIELKTSLPLTHIFCSFPTFETQTIIPTLSPSTAPIDSNIPLAEQLPVVSFKLFSKVAFPEKAMAPHSSTLAWKIPWMEEPGRLQRMGSLRVRHDWTTSLSFFTFMH